MQIPVILNALRSGWDFGLDSTTQAVIGLLAGGLTILSTIYLVWRAFKNRLHIRRVEKPNDPDLEAALDLEDRYFGSNVGEDIDDARRWLRELRQEKKKKINKWDEYRIILKHKGSVIGTLYASYCLTAKLLFLSYIVIDRSSDLAKHCGRDRLIYAMLRFLRRDRHSWEGIVGEVEEKKRDERSGKIRNHAIEVMSNFQSSIEKFSKKAMNSVLCRLCIKYTQPYLQPEQIESGFDGSDDASDINQWLLYLSRVPSEIVAEEEILFIRKKRIMEILRFIYLDVYGDAHVENEGYRKYLSAGLKKYEEVLPELVQVTTDCRGRDMKQKW